MLTISEMYQYRLTNAGNVLHTAGSLSLKKFFFQRTTSKSSKKKNVLRSTVINVMFNGEHCSALVFVLVAIGIDNISVKKMAKCIK